PLEKAIAAAPCTVPSAAQPLEPALVKGGGALAALDPGQHPGVNGGEGAERDPGGDDPGRRDGGADKREPQGQRDRGCRRQTQVREQEMTAVEGGETFAPARQPGSVLAAGISDHGIRSVRLQADQAG